MQNKDTNDRQKIIKELLDVTDTEFTDEELIHQLITTNFSKNSEDTKKQAFARSKSLRRCCEIRGQLGVYFQLYCSYGYMDGFKRRSRFKSL